MNHYEMLRNVSRTFSLSIEKLPSVLRDTITIAYLLFRIADCIEDHSAIASNRKAHLLRLWSDILAGNRPAHDLTIQLKDLDDTDPEVYVACHADSVIAYLDTIPGQLRNIITAHAAKTAQGMARWQEQGPFVATEEEMDDYMHQVAGRVGYLLTEIFSWYSPVIQKKHTSLLPLGREFGLGLQTVNIIRGLRKDYERGWVFVPATFLEKNGLTRETFFDTTKEDKALSVINLLIKKAKRHLDNGLTYITLLPRNERRIRLACIWPLLFAVKTLALSRNNLEVITSETKMTRPQVKNIVIVSSMLCWSNTALKQYYRHLEA
jgi:farnesyl-diphosphate farnesyltransferase